MANDALFRFIEQLKDKLFEPEERRLKRGIDRLVEMHEEIKGPSYMTFMFGGEKYCHSRATTISTVVPMLAWELNEEMEKWLKDRKSVNLDKDQIGQMIFRLQDAVMKTGHEQELQERRDALPECLVFLVPGFQSIPRRFNIEFFLRTERDMRQYQKILPKIEMYAMSKLIY